MVLRVDKEKGYIDLSKRRVSPEDLKACDERFNKSKMVHSIVRHVAETTGVSLQDIQEQITWPLYKEYGHAFEAFKLVRLSFAVSAFVPWLPQRPSPASLFIRHSSLRFVSLPPAPLSASAAVPLFLALITQALRWSFTGTRAPRATDIPPPLPLACFLIAQPWFSPAKLLTSTAWRCPARTGLRFAKTPMRSWGS